MIEIKALAQKKTIDFRVEKSAFLSFLFINVIMPLSH